MYWLEVEQLEVVERNGKRRVHRTTYEIVLCLN